MDDPAREIQVLVGAPTPDPDGFFCPYQVKGIGDEKISIALGFDALQALEEVVHMLPVELAVLLRDYPTLRWEDGPVGYFAFRRHPGEF